MLFSAANKAHAGCVEAPLCVMSQAFNTLSAAAAAVNEKGRSHHERSPSGAAGSDDTPPEGETAAQRRKRTRPVSACEACRAHKVKCILKPDEPICERCASSGKECLFRIDDLRPDFRAKRFSHLGPPGAEAREIKSKPKERRRSSCKKEASAGSDDALDDELGELQEGNHERHGRKRDTDSAGFDDEGAPKAKSKPVFKSWANPGKLAAPLAVKPSESEQAKAGRPGHLAQSPSYHGAPPMGRHSASSSSISSGPYQPQAVPWGGAPVSAAMHPPGASYPYGQVDGYYGQAPGMSGRPNGAFGDYAGQPHPPVYPAADPSGGPHLGSARGNQQTFTGSADMIPSSSDRGHGLSVSSAGSPNAANLPPIRMAFPSLGAEANSPGSRSTARYVAEWERPSTAGGSSDARSERPYSPVVASHLPRFASSRAQHLPTESEKVMRSEAGNYHVPPTNRVTFQSPPEESPNTSAVNNHGNAPESTGSRGSGGKKTSLVVPFFRWFGLTANTPGYRRIKVAVNPDLPDEEDGVPKGTEQIEGSQAVEGGTGESNANAAGMASSPNTSSAVKRGISPAPEQAEESAVVSVATPKVKGADFAQGHAPRFFSHFDHDSIASSSSRDLFDPSKPRMPRQDILLHLCELFIKQFRTNLCPWIIEEELLKSVRNGTMASILANSICAMTARFSDWTDLKRKAPKGAGEPFSEMAKTLLVPMLSWPSLDVIEALIILSYAEFGAGSDSGLWMYSGMGMRMAMDLGIQHESTIQSLPSKASQAKARWIFWSGCYSIDRITCFGTGRPVTLLDHAIDCQPPIAEPSSDVYYASLIIQILLRRGRMGELLNRRDDGLKLSDKKTKLMEMWQECAAYFQSLPSSCAFGVQSFKRAANNNQGSAFLYLHVLFQSTISLLERPGLMRGREADANVSSYGQSVTHISASASRSIVDMIALASQVNPMSFHACPYLDQLILPTGRLFVAEREAVHEAMRQCGYTPGQSRQSSPTRGLTKGQEDRLTSLVRHRKGVSDHLQNCIAWLSTLAHYWGGASWPARALEQEAAGASDVIPDADDDDAMQAPLRDMELLSSWAKDKMKQAKGRMAANSRRGSASAAAVLGNASRRAGVGRGDGGSSGSGPSSMASPGAATSIENLLAAANAAQSKGTVGGTSPGDSDNNPLGLALSGQLATSAEIDVHALVDMWAAEQERVQAGNGTHGANTPSNGRVWDPSSLEEQHHTQNQSQQQQPEMLYHNQPHVHQARNTGMQPRPQFGPTSGYQQQSPAQHQPQSYPLMDFSALQLEELLSADLGRSTDDSDVLPLELPIEDFPLSMNFFNAGAGGFAPAANGNGDAGGNSGGGGGGAGGAGAQAGLGGSGGSGGTGEGHSGSHYQGDLQGISSALFGFH
ncbi:unnamed protein product [Jaminaea pallidilutea]